MDGRSKSGLVEPKVPLWKVPFTGIMSVSSTHFSCGEGGREGGREGEREREREREREKKMGSIWNTG